MAGKRITKRMSDAYSWLVVTDSHGSLMMDTLERHGVNSIVIHGGGIDHANEYLKRNDYFRGRMNGIFLR